MTIFLLPNFVLISVVPVLSDVLLKTSGFASETLFLTPKFFGQRFRMYAASDRKQFMPVP